MKFVIQKKENILSLARKLGYASARFAGEELSCIRILGNNGYPRFHLYIKQEKDNIFFTLHLDQKKPSYGHNPSHSGEYEGDLVEGEKERIIKIIS